MENKKLPNFFVVGAARCGTTSLYNYVKDSGENHSLKAVDESLSIQKSKINPPLR